MGRMERAIVLMPGPYDSRGEKVNEVNMYDVFGSQRRSHASRGLSIRPLDQNVFPVVSNNIPSIFLCFP